LGCPSSFVITIKDKNGVEKVFEPPALGEFVDEDMEIVK